jgi:hypothetical protein
MLVVVEVVYMILEDKFQIQVEQVDQVAVEQVEQLLAHMEPMEQQIPAVVVEQVEDMIQAQLVFKVLAVDLV